MRRNMFNGSFRSLQSTVASFTRAAGSAQRVLSLIDMKPDSAWRAPFRSVVTQRSADASRQSRKQGASSRRAARCAGTSPSSTSASRTRRDGLGRMPTHARHSSRSLTLLRRRCGRTKRCWTASALPSPRAPCARSWAAPAAARAPVRGCLPTVCCPRSYLTLLHPPPHPPFSSNPPHQFAICYCACTTPPLGPSPSTESTCGSWTCGGCTAPQASSPRTRSCLPIPSPTTFRTAYTTLAFFTLFPYFPTPDFFLSQVRLPFPRDPGGGGGGCEGGARARLHLRIRGGVRHALRGAGGAPVGGAEAAVRARRAPLPIFLSLVSLP